MHRSPLAVLALAAALLSPAIASAHARDTRLPTAAHRLVSRPTRLQHPQPTSFRHAPAQTRTGRAPLHPQPARLAHQPAARVTASSRHPGRRVRGRRLLATLAPPRPTRLRRPTPDLDNPAQPSSIISIVRPTAGSPQLPSIQQAAAEPIILPSLYSESGRLLVPTPLFGSHEILVHQNEMADQDGLGRVQDDADLDAMRARGMLVGLPASELLHVDERLPYNRRFCRPWTAQFLNNLAHAFYAQFHTPLQVNSAVRTVAFQLRLQRTNGNAAPAEGDTASPHLTGQAVDIGKRGLTLPQIAWLRGYLLPLMQSGRVDVEEEFQQSCFHISVYRRYLPPSDNLAQRYPVTTRNTASLVAPIR